MRISRTGLLKVTRFAHETTSSSWDSEAVAYAWPAKLEDLDEFGKPFPVLVFTYPQRVNIWSFLLRTNPLKDTQ